MDLRPQSGLNVIVGENAQGKTNILEAIFICALSKSRRTSKDGELIKHDCAGAYIGADIVNRTGDHSIEVKLRAGERKSIFIDKELIKRTGELMGVLNAVMFAPEDLELVKDGPAARRQFMDMELSQLRPAYYYKLQQYNFALKQRNALLKEAYNPDSGQIRIWDEQIAAYGSDIMKYRMEFIDGLSTLAMDIHRRLTGGAEILTVNYLPNVNREQLTDDYSALMDALYDALPEDTRRGFTSAGPHRDDLLLEINGMEARVYGSQGQQRTAALSLKLSELAFMREEKNDSPVLLLDDVLSELDDSRQRMLLESIGGCQTFITCTSLAGLKSAGMENLNVFLCKGGALTKGTA